MNPNSVTRVLVAEGEVGEGRHHFGDGELVGRRGKQLLPTVKLVTRSTVSNPQEQSHSHPAAIMPR